MLPRSYENQVCSVAGSLEVVGDRWTMLVVRESFLGTRRFDDFQRALGIPRTVLTSRLSRLVDDGILFRTPYQDHPKRFEYRLTEKGVELWPVIVALLKWGDRWVMDGNAPMLLLHVGCGGSIDDRRECELCGAKVGPREVRAQRTGMGAAETDPTVTFEGDGVRMAEREGA